MAVDARRGMVYVQLFDEARTRPSDAAAACTRRCRRADRREAGHRRRLRRRGGRGRRRGGRRRRPRRASPTCSRTPARWRCWPPISTPSTPVRPLYLQAARRQAAGRQVPDPRARPMSRAIDYKHVSILWAAPEHAAELAKLHAGLFDAPWDAAAFRESAQPSRLDRVPGARRRAAADGRASSWASSPPTRPRSSPWASARTASGTASAAGWSRRWPRRQEGRGAAAVPRGGRRTTRRRWRSTRGSASRRSGGARATTSAPARPPRTR